MVRTQSFDFINVLSQVRWLGLRWFREIKVLHIGKVLGNQIVEKS